MKEGESVMSKTKMKLERGNILAKYYSVRQHHRNDYLRSRQSSNSVKMKVLSITISALLVGMSQSVYVRECFNDSFDTPKPPDVRVEGCTATPCKLRRNGTFSIEFDFVIREDADIVRPEFCEIYDDIYQPYLVYPEDLSCNGIKNTKCPLKAGQNVTYANTMTVYDKAEYGYGLGRFVLYKGVKSRTKIICFELPVIILQDNINEIKFLI